MTTPDITYRVVAARGAQQLAIKDGFLTKEEAQQYVEDHRFDDASLGFLWRLRVVEDKSRKRLYYEFIDSLLENARCELTPQDMMELINDLGVVLDMHCDGIRREVESEYDEE